ncbi:SDR family oxidoreductase [Dolichospermum circinale]|uniref:SDR family oxidoreductase n=1 Tax=Dolichospermum circinale TaxID=109265 RepID=UPI0009DB8A84|nr:SDR family oxidoreductase [Dolichospermum circinale]MDB9475048.1 SDR family oxidoreductase [Dolichospermum circinale CS-537/11]MDB9480054.1 SDR family oxidoreductase [Dolichospermum circinale CS-537/03]MDB9484309.1 SDR family oxidoreductase [Dolichospermum circinale CS-537/05]
MNKIMLQDGKRCLVTGAAGFIGSHLCDRLLKSGHSVLGLDNLITGRTLNLKVAQNHSSFTFIEQDLADISPDTLIDIDWVFHLAGLADLVPSIQNPGNYYHANIHSTFALLEACRHAHIEKFIYTASSTCYGIPDQYPTPETYPCHPEHPYGLTKYLGEQLVMHWAQVYQIPALSLRLFNVYGTRSRTTGAYGAVFGVFLAQKLAGKPFTVVGDGTQTRDFTFVSDVVEAFVKAAESDITGEIINIGSGKSESILTLVKLLDGPIIYIPKRPGEPDCTWADITKATTLLKWQPQVTLNQGVAEMLANIDLWRDAPVWTPETIHQETQSWFERLGQKLA